MTTPARLTPRDIRRLLAAHNLTPRKHLGQHFVVDPNTCEKAVREADVGPGDVVCEVGAGLGSLTVALLAAGARVVAVEIDPGLVAALRSVVGTHPRAEVVHDDALGLDYREVLAAPSGVFVGNLPYHVATPIVLEALASPVFTRLVAMTQREVGLRWTADPGEPPYGAVSVKVAAHAEARIVGKVSRQAFYPVPHVDSVLVRLRPRAWSYDVPRAAVLRVVEAGFSQRRKMLRNTLASLCGSGDAAADRLRAAGLAPTARAEQLGLEDWVRLARSFERP